MILLILIGLFAVLGCIIGAVKGFTKVKSWAVEYLIVAALTMLIGTAIAGLESDVATAIIVIAAGLALIIVMTVLFKIFRAIVNKSIEKRKKYSYYEKYDEIHENEEKIADAVASKDKSRYNKLVNRKFKQSGGTSSVVNRILGAIVNAVNGAVIAAIVGLFVLAVLDLAQLGVTETLGAFFYGAAWEAFKPYIFDFMVIGFMMLAVKNGFQSGISNTLWSLVVIGMVVLAGYIAYNLAFNVETFNRIAESISEKIAEAGGEMLSPEIAITVARVILTAGLFLVMLVVVVLISIFVPRLINLARDGNAFYIIDGIFGALFAVVLVIGILLVVGSAVQSFYDYEFMDIFNAYFEKSGIAIHFYGRNPIGGLIQMQPAG